MANQPGLTQPQRRTLFATIRKARKAESEAQG